MASGREVALYVVKVFADEKAFLRALTHPVLVWTAPPAAKEQAQHFSTKPGGRPKNAQVGQPIFYDVKKSVKSAFADEITIGRTSNNDVAIEDNSVSRFHAYLVLGKAGWSVVDCKSSGGTWLDGHKLKAQVPTPIKDKSKLRLGEVELDFFEPATFAAWLKRLAK